MATAQWIADSLNSLANGADVTTWTDSLAGKVATVVNTAPNLTKDALNGHSVVSFSKISTHVGDGLEVAAAANPLSGANDFTIGLVFRTSTAGVGTNSSWYENTGLVDNEQAGVTTDWGLVLSSNGSVGAGLGSPDMTVYSASGKANGLGHVVIYSRSGGNVTLDIDGTSYTGTGGSTLARNIERFAIGELRTGYNNYTGDIAEIAMFQSALQGSGLEQFGYNLATKYGIANTYVNQTINAIPDASAVLISAGASLDLSNTNEVIGSLSGATGSSVALGTGNMTCGGDNTSTIYNGTFTGSGGLIQNGSGTMTLNSDIAYSGNTVVNGGTLQVKNFNEASASTANVQVNSGAQLVVSGKMHVNKLTIAAGAKVRLGAFSGGTLAADPDLMTVPEPGTLGMLAIAGMLLSLGVMRRQRKVS